MISPEVCYEEYYIKKEENVEYLEDVKEELVFESRQIVFENETAKCGEVMVGYQGEFTFICALCMQPFVELRSFGNHIKDIHLSHNSMNTVSIQTDRNSDPLCEKRSIISISPQRETTPELPPLVPISAPKPIQKELEIDILDTVASSDCNVNEVSSDEGSSDEDNKPIAVFSNRCRRTTKVGDFFCGFCGRNYQTKNSFAAHMKKKHPDSIESTQSKEELVVRVPDQMVCKYCDKEFDDLVEFKAHVHTHTGRKRFVCPFCGKLFASRHNRQSHINVHTGERPYKCSLCPKGFSDATNLAMHERAHLRIRNYSCDYCDKRFVQSQEKKVHERTHTGEKPFQCEECGKRFISHVKLTEHGRRHKNIKNYVCMVCSKAFYSSGQLKDHSIMHTNERPHHCNVCGQSFPRLKSLRAHQQLHSNEKKYVCDTCGKAFAQCAGLYSHRKSHGEKL